MLNRALLGALAALPLAFAGTQASGQEIFGSRFTHQLTPPEFCQPNRDTAYAAGSLSKPKATRARRKPRGTGRSARSASSRALRGGHLSSRLCASPRPREMCGR